MDAVFLWMFVINLGVVFGAGLYEARISVPRWLGPSRAAGPGFHPDQANLDDVGRRFWAFTTTVPLTLLTLANLWAALHSSADVRFWWLTAATMAFADRVFTFAYFIPKMVALLGSSNSPEAEASMRRWVKLNYVRLSIVFVAWLAALESFALVHGRMGTT
jgi:hypothetical protein